jgi:CDP-paratose 2-epimerase
VREIQRVLVTGGAGFIGSHVAEYYSWLGKEVIVIDDLSRMALLEQDDPNDDQNSIFVRSLPRAQFYRESILDPGGVLTDAADAVELIVHTAAQTAVTTSMTDPETDFEVNALGTLRVLEAARKAQSQPAVVFCSTNKVYGDRPNSEFHRVEGETRYEVPADWRGVKEDLGVDDCEHSPYGCSKLAADLYCQDYARLFGLKVGIFRMSCIYGPRQMGVADQGWVAWFARAVLEGKPITIYGNGKQIRDALYVTDLVRAYDLFVNSDFNFGIFNTGGGSTNTVSLLELIALLKEITGREAEVDFTDWRPSDQKVYVSNIDRLSLKLGWMPETGVRAGVEKLIASLNS